MTIAINGSVLCSFVGKYLHMGIEMKFYRAEIKIISIRRLAYLYCPHCLFTGQKTVFALLM